MGACGGVWGRGGWVVGRGGVRVVGRGGVGEACVLLAAGAKRIAQRKPRPAACCSSL